MLTLYKPKKADLWFRKKLLSDPQTMSYNDAWGGIVDFPENRWEAWYKTWVSIADKRFYRYLLRKETGEFIGEIAYHFDDSKGIYLISIIIDFDKRKKGFGKMGLDLLCRAAKKNGISTLYDSIAKNNPAVKLFLNNGFEVEYRTDDAIMLKRKL